MKRIEELGISQWPWKTEFCELNDEKSPFVVGTGDNVSSLDGQFCESDANLIAAAPELYEALRDAIIAECIGCRYCGLNPKYECNNHDCRQAPAKWRAAIAKAAGEEVACGK